MGTCHSSDLSISIIIDQGPAFVLHAVTEKALDSACTLLSSPIPQWLSVSHALPCTRNKERAGAGKVSGGVSCPEQSCKELRVLVSFFCFVLVLSSQFSDGLNQTHTHTNTHTGTTNKKEHLSSRQCGLNHKEEKFARLLRDLHRSSVTMKSMIHNTLNGPVGPFLHLSALSLGPFWFSRQ